MRFSIEQTAPAGNFEKAKTACPLAEEYSNSSEVLQGRSSWEGTHAAGELPRVFQNLILRPGGAQDQ